MRHLDKTLMYLYNLVSLYLFKHKDMVKHTLIFSIYVEHIITYGQELNFDMMIYMEIVKYC